MWTGADRYVEVAYFTSEADAREGEKKQPPPELAAQMADFEAMMANVEFIDLRDFPLRGIPDAPCGASQRAAP